MSLNSIRFQIPERSGVRPPGTSRASGTDAAGLLPADDRNSPCRGSDPPRTVSLKRAPAGGPGRTTDRERQLGWLLGANRRGFTFLLCYHVT